MPNKMTLDELGKQLPDAGRFRFLNYAGTAPVLSSTVACMETILKESAEPLAVHFDRWLALVSDARKTVADAIGARPDEIAFTPNTSTALSIVAGTQIWKTGDRILYPADEFPSNRYVWDNLAAFGVRAEAVRPEPGVPFFAQLKKMNLRNVRLVASSLVSYHDGRREDIGKLSAFAHEKNILVAVDAIQGAGAVPVNVGEWGCDFLACGGQKWLMGPAGSGFLYVRKAVMPKLHVPLVGWASAEKAGDFEIEKLEFAASARRFEPGFYNIAAVAGLAKSVDTLARVGWETIFDGVRENNERLRAGLEALGYPPIHHGPPETQSGIVTISVPDEQKTEAIEKKCAEARIFIKRRPREIRLAAHAATTPEVIDAFLGVLETF